jgi:hypothetical protein
VVVMEDEKVGYGGEEKEHVKEKKEGKERKNFMTFLWNL